MNRYEVIDVFEAGKAQVLIQGTPKFLPVNDECVQPPPGQICDVE